MKVMQSWWILKVFKMKIKIHEIATKENIIYRSRGQHHDMGYCSYAWKTLVLAIKEKLTSQSNGFFAMN